MKKADVNYPNEKSLSLNQFPNLNQLLNSRVYWIKDHIYLRKGPLMLQ